MAFTDGMVVPAGTGNTVSSSLYVNFYLPLMNTLFQSGLVSLMLITAAVVCCMYAIRKVWVMIRIFQLRRSRRVVSDDDVPLSSFGSGKLERANAESDVNYRGRVTV